MKCDAVMTNKPACCLPKDQVLKAALIMKRLDIGAVPIIETEENKKIVGILTDRDLAIRIVAEKLEPQSMLIEETMTQNVVTCQSDDDLQVALDLMAENQLRRIPVVDRKNRIVGIIAQADVATRLNQPEKTAKVVKDISQSKEE
jgi:CBS domain-containing protein